MAIGDVFRYRDEVIARLAKMWKVDPWGMSKYCGIDMTHAYIPKDMILPMGTGTTTPSGFSAYAPTGLLYRYIIGAGSTYNVGDYITATNLNPPVYAAGAHAGAQDVYFGANPGNAGQSSKASHTHTITLAWPFYPRYFGKFFNQCNEDTDTLPQYCAVLKDGTGGWTGMTRRGSNGNNAYLMPHTSDTESLTASKACSVSTDDAHNHGTNDGIKPPGSGGGAWGAMLSGDHTHTLTANITWSLNSYNLNCWYPAGASGIKVSELPNFIGMYPSTTPPPGFSLCNGSNGTPDLRDRFIRLNIADTAGGTYGDGKIYLTGESSTYTGHRHWDGVSACNSCPRALARHYYIEASHSHNLVTTGITKLPSYYALAFIMYTG